MTGTDVSSFVYNGLGDRYQQIVNSATTTYQLDLAAGMVNVLADGENTYLYGNAVLAQVSDTQTGYYLPDVLGSVRQMTSPTGEVQLSQRFTPFGEVKEKYGDGEANFGYTGQKFDAQTGLLYLRARYYAPGMGRFISHDTWSGDANMTMSYNAWLYGYGNPVRYVDPSGNKQVITTETVMIWDYNNLPWGVDGYLDPKDLPTATLFAYEYTELGIKVYKLPNRNGKFNRNASQAYLGYYEMVKDYGNIDASGYPFHVQSLSQLEQMDIRAFQMKAWNWAKAGFKCGDRCNLSWENCCGNQSWRKHN